MTPVYQVQKKLPDDRIIALVGNPNVGKSTVFNGLTGSSQHTGNWPGKTVAVAQGRYVYKGRGYILVDLPGTYSLASRSEEERVAAEFILSGQADCTVIVTDATCLERNLILAQQVLELSAHAVLAVNLMDEARRLGEMPSPEVLERRLRIPTVGTSANRGTGLPALMEAVRRVCDGFAPPAKRPERKGEEQIRLAEELAAEALGRRQTPKSARADRLVLGKFWGRALMLGLLLVVLWITIWGANYPTRLLQQLFDLLERKLLFMSAPWPQWLSGILIGGVYHTCTTVVAVMLPPMAIFFPVFTLLEDLGYLPRAAFLMDHSFSSCGGCGKQVLTMAMGFGCNAVGVTGCRIIASPRERLAAILTNALVPCNGRFPILITLIGVFFTDRSLPAAGLLSCFLLLSVAATYLLSAVLNATVLRGQPSDFVLELPPYRKPRVLQVLVRAFLDRTVRVLGRAVLVAAPAGAVLWLLETCTANGQPLLQILAEALDSTALLFGLNGAILLAFLLSFPANELLLPLVLTISEVSAVAQLGWDLRTVLCVLVLTLFHWPCSTTCLTIRKETGSWGWTLLAMALPTALGLLLCMLIRWIA